MAYFYVASPYTHEDPAVRHHRFLLAEHYVANALKRQHWVYSPIVHCHELAKKHKLPHDHKFWLTYDFALLAPAQGLEILQLPGWRESKGVAEEEKFAESWDFPIIYITMQHPWLRDFQAA